jgi:hypothetical protein
LLSAEWIVEAARNAAYLVQPIADFGTVTVVAQNGANGVTPTLLNRIVMENPNGQWAAPSAVGASDTFNVCWSYGTQVPENNC